MRTRARACASIRACAGVCMCCMCDACAPCRSVELIRWRFQIILHLSFAQCQKVCSMAVFFSFMVLTSEPSGLSSCFGNNLHMHACTRTRMNGRTDGRTDGRMQARTQACICPNSHSSVYTSTCFHLHTHLHARSSRAQTRAQAAHSALAEALKLIWTEVVVRVAHLIPSCILDLVLHPCFLARLRIHASARARMWARMRACVRVVMCACMRALVRTAWFGGLHEDRWSSMGQS